jgi:hypothetical protein
MICQVYYCQICGKPESRRLCFPLPVFPLLFMGTGTGVPGLGGVPGIVVGGPGTPSGPGAPGMIVSGVPGLPGV